MKLGSGPRALEDVVNHPSPKHEHLFAAACAALVFLWLALAACGSANGGPEPGPADAAGGADAGALDSGWDASRSDAGRSDAGAVDAGADAGFADSGRIDEHGFAIRTPLVRTIPCGGPFCPDPVTAPDEDHLCTFKVGSVDGFLYFQATPLRFVAMQGCEYETVGGWVSVGGRVTSVECSYDFGGNHHNDSVTFTYSGQTYRYYHSSLGVGWRACQPMDCIQLMTGNAVTEDGCGPGRSIPIVCVRVAADGTTAPLVDHYAKCPGDPNAKDGGP